MRGCIKYISILIIVSFVMLIISGIILNKNMTYVELKNVCSPEDISYRFGQRNIYNYLNIYDIYTNENISVYTGNMNIMLKYCDVTGTVAYSDDEVIVGEKNCHDYTEEYLNTKQKFYSKEYKINGIIKGSNRMYFSDTSLLDKDSIKKQYIYIGFSDDDNGQKYKKLSAANIFRNIETTAYVINYTDVLNVLQIIICLLLIVLLVMILTMRYRELKVRIKDIGAIVNKNKLEYSIYECIFKKTDKEKLKRGIYLILVCIALIIGLLAISIYLSKIYLTFTVDLSSMKSIIAFIKYIYNIVAYSLTSGFSMEASVVAMIIAVYIVILLIFIIKLSYDKLKKAVHKRKNKDISVEAV